LKPGEITYLVKERIIDTVIGSIIAAVAARFILPLWERERIEEALAQMLAANRQYFRDAWAMTTAPDATRGIAMKKSRSKAIVALANLSDRFQMMLAEPGQNERSVSIHQMVIANHMLTGHIAALPSMLPKDMMENERTQQIALFAEQELIHAENQVLHRSTPSEHFPVRLPNGSGEPLNPLGIVYALAHDLRRISQRMQR
jgi:uncharacterized membrane protein YccC